MCEDNQTNKDEEAENKRAESKKPTLVSKISISFGTRRPIRYRHIPGCGLTEFKREYGPNDGDRLTD